MVAPRVTDLADRRILLILVSRTDPRAARFVAGRVNVADGLGSVETSSGTRVELEADVAGLRGFDPAMLGSLIVPRHYPDVAALADGVEACVAIFSAAEPAGAHVARNAFYGMAVDARGGVLLMQGDPRQFIPDQAT